MLVNHLVKMQTGWTHEKGRFGVYPPDMSFMDSPSLIASTGTALGFTLPSPMMNTDQDTASAGTYAQNVRTKWLNAGCLYESSGISEVETPALEFLDLKYGSYISATFKLKGFVLDASAIGDPNHMPYAMGLWCGDYLIAYWPYYVDPEDYHTNVPTLALYLGGGYAKNPLFGDHCLVCCPWAMFVPPTRTGYSPTPMQSRFTPQWKNSAGVVPAYKYWYAGWNYLDEYFVRHGHAVTHSSVGEEGYDMIHGTYAPFGRAIYDEDEVALPEAYATLVKASSSSTPTGTVWHNSAAGFTPYYREKDVEI